MLTSLQGKVTEDPFRRGLGEALVWIDILQTRVNARVEAVIDQAWKKVTDEETQSVKGEEEAGAAGLHDTSPSPAPAARTHCAQQLQKLCPACFSGREFGTPLERYDFIFGSAYSPRWTPRGGDIHIGFDGNFHHRHAISGGTGVEFYAPELFLSQEEVNVAEKELESARKKARGYTGRVPEGVLEACRESYHAAKGDDEEHISEKFDSTGLVAAVCRHDIPVVFINVDTAGTQIQCWSLCN
jgi:hypothetical protein